MTSASTSQNGRNVRLAIWALLIAAHVGLIALALGRNLDFLFNDGVHRGGPATDWFVYFLAGKYWAHDMGMYNVERAFGYRYHPCFAIFIGSTFAQLEEDPSFYAWVVFNEFVLLSLLLWFRQLFPKPKMALAAGALLLLFTPQWLDVYMGQSTLLCAACAFHGLMLWQRERRSWATVLLCAAIIIKPSAAVVLPLLLFRRQYTLAGTIILIVAFTAIFYFGGDPGGWAKFLKINLEAVPDKGWVVHAGHHGLHGFLSAFFARTNGLDTSQLASFSEFPAWANFILRALPFLVGALGLLVAFRLRHRVEAMFFVLSATYLVGYKDVWEHSYSFILPALLLLLAAPRFLNPKLLWVCAIGLALPTPFLFYDAPIDGDPEHVWSTGTSLLHHAWKPTFLLVLYVAATIKAWRPDEHDQSPGG